MALLKSLSDEKMRPGEGASDFRTIPDTRGRGGSENANFRRTSFITPYDLYAHMWRLSHICAGYHTYVKVIITYVPVIITYVPVYHHICEGYHHICEGYHHICGGYHHICEGYHHICDGVSSYM